MSKRTGKKSPKKKQPRRKIHLKQSPSTNKKGSSKRQDVSLNELKKILEKSRTKPLSDEEIEKLGGAVDTLAVVTQELE